MNKEFASLGLNNALLDNLESMGFKEMTDIQAMSLPAIIEGKDVVGKAKTGSGKTAAFGLGLLHNLKVKRFRVQALVMCPTRELAEQVALEIRKLGRGIHNIKVLTLCGGTPLGPQIGSLEHGAHIIVGTPGRLMDHLFRQRLDLSEVNTLVLDEADRMLDMGFSESINRIAAEARWRKQTMLFSATLESAGVSRFAREVLTEPVFLESNPSRKEKAKIHQWLHIADDFDHKLELLYNILKQEDVTRVVVFANKRETVQTLSGKLYAQELPCVWLEGKMQQDKRNTAIERLKNGTVDILVATDVAARGLDIDDISHVINFDMPRKVDVYIHRIGRTGRAGNKGTALSLVEAHDMPVIAKIERFQDERFPRRVIEGLRPKNKESRVAMKKPKIKRSTSQKKAKAKKQAKKSK